MYRHVRKTDIHIFPLAGPFKANTSYPILFVGNTAGKRHTKRLGIPY